MGKLALITGGNSGIGATSVHRFLTKGYKVLNVDRIHGNFGNTEEEIHVTLDLSDVNHLEEAVQDLIDTHGVPDVTINCAGISRMDFAIEAKLSDWQETFNLNVFAVFLISKVVARNLIATDKPGRIIQISSQAGKNGYRGMTSYVASKHAVIGLTKSMAIELAPNNILVNAVCPGIVETPMKARERVIGGELRGLSAEDVRQEDISQVPLGRTATPDDVVDVIEFLSSEKASYMTGQAINVTGGMTMH